MFMYGGKLIISAPGNETGYRYCVAKYITPHLGSTKDNILNINIKVNNIEYSVWIHPKIDRKIHKEISDLPPKELTEDRLHDFVIQILLKRLDATSLKTISKVIAESSQAAGEYKIQKSIRDILKVPCL